MALASPAWLATWLNVALRPGILVAHKLCSLLGRICCSVNMLLLHSHFLYVMVSVLACT